MAMTLEEAEYIARNRLPGEPPVDPVASWRANKPPPEPAREPQKLDTMPAPQIDWALVIRQALLGERAHMVEAVGQAIGEHGNGLLGEIETMIAATAAELREEFARAIDQLRSELSGRIDSTQTHGAELKAQLEVLLAKRRRAKAAKPNGSALLLPAPALADATLAPGANGNGCS
jgi:hypothetical protein